MIIIGLTGGIGSGKSTIARELHHLGARVLDADQLAREVVQPGLPAYDEIVLTFGEEILNPDGTINRAELGAVVFGDPALRERLALITHPRIREEQARRLAKFEEEDPDGLVILEVALLIETGMHQLVPHVLLAYCDAETQVQRVMRRDSLPEELALARVRAQWPLIEKVPFANFVVDTSGELNWTIRQVDQLYPLLVSLGEEEPDEDEELPGDDVLADDGDEDEDIG